ncbi:hypothetical protein L915_07654 [Phytophthora nicotianae]|uniref:Uncharacterized protein n=1 Tax=Phytophthora nicotianae TaxID=4792 RepID=W2GYI5_PHYNI|nr:hypothetical protein L915_07654 [Phytophthora nicotianae]
MPRNTAKGGAKAPAKAVARKAHAKNSKRHSKGSALKEATKVASEIDASGDSAESKRRSTRRSPSPSMSSDDRPNPRFACREHSPGSEDEAKARSSHSVSGSSWKGTLQCPASTALTACTRSLVITLITAKHSKKHMASRSPLREGMETDSYYMMFDSSDEEEEGAIAEPQEITNGIYRQQDLFQAAQRKPGG